MRPSDVSELLDHVHDARQVLWRLAASLPQTRASRAASRARDSLSESERLLHDLRRLLGSIEAHPAGKQLDPPPAKRLYPPAWERE